MIDGILNTNPANSLGPMAPSGIDWASVDPDKSMRADELSLLLTSQWGPYLEKALKRFGESMTPEGRMRLSRAFRQRQLAAAQDTAQSQSTFIRGQGYNPLYAKGLGLNAFNRAQRESTNYDTQLTDPGRDAQSAMSIFGGLASATPPQQQDSGGSFLGDLFSVAGSFVPGLGGLFGGGKKKSFGDGGINIGNNI